MDWTRCHTIGRGSSATVSLAACRHTGDALAVKSTELAGSEWLQREQRILSSLSSPHVVSYRGAGITEESNKSVYNLFMEYLPGGTLVDAVRRRGGRMEEQMIRHYARQIATGLDYLHSVGLVHCDIKGRNILVRDQIAKIGDLGCAKWTTTPTPTPTTGDRNRAGVVPMSGTPAFMAPEVARGEEQGFPADVWALGCTVIEMATGGSPWPEAVDPVSVLYRVGFLGESPDIPGCLSDQGKDFLGKCLKRDVGERWTAGELLKHPFLEDLDSHPKGVQGTDSVSPTSVLVQGFWESVEESEALGCSTREGSSAGRIRQLTSFSEMPRWRGGEDWMTVRGSNVEGGQWQWQ